MKPYNKILIDGQPVDLFEDQENNFLLDRIIEDLDGSTRGDYSLSELQIPKTKNNDSIIKEAGVFMSIIATANGLQTFRGLATLVRVDHNLKPYGLTRAKSYRLELTSSNSSWIQLLQNTTLSELTDTKISFTSGNVQIGTQAAPQIRDYAFGFIKWKEWENNNGQTGADFLYTPSFTEATPLLYIAPLVRAGFAKAGYNIVSDWLDSETIQKRVIDVPLPDKMPQAYNEAYTNTAAISNGFTFLTGTSGNIPCDVITKTPIENPTAYNNSTYEYTVPYDGFFEMKLSATFGATPPPETTYFWFASPQLNGTSLTNDPIGYSYTPNPLSFPNRPFIPNGTYTESVIVSASAGDVLTWEFLAGGTNTMLSALVEFNGEAAKQTGLSIDFKYFLTEDLFLDMLSGLKAAYNLSFETNENTKTVYLEPSDGNILVNQTLGITEYKEGLYKSNTKNYDSLIDLSKRSYEDYTIAPKVRKLKWEFDQDPTADALNEGSGLQVYEATFTSGLESATGQEDFVVVPYFAACLHVLDIETRHPESSKTPQFPLIYSQDYFEDPTSTSANYNTRRHHMHFEGIRPSGQDGYFEVLEWGKFPVPALFMVNSNADNPALSPNLGFSDFTTSGGTSIGLARRYYLQSLERTEKSAVRNCFVFFNQVDNINFSFQKKAYLEGIKYIIQKIKSFNPDSDDSVNFLFLEDKVPDGSTLDKKTDSLLNPIVSLNVTE